MTTNIVDTSIRGSSFATGYTGAGTIAASARNAAGLYSMTSGFFTSNGNATQINVGFRPLAIKVVNITDGITWEWTYGMLATQAIKTVLGGSLTSALDTSSQLTISTDLAGNHTVTLGTTLNGTAKVLAYRIEG